MKTELRVYVIDVDVITEETYYDDLSDEQFMDIAEENGRVYTLPNFQEAFNEGYVNTAIDVIRIIEVPSDY